MGWGNGGDRSGSEGGGARGERGDLGSGRGAWKERGRGGLGDLRAGGRKGKRFEGNGGLWPVGKR